MKCGHEPAANHIGDVWHETYRVAHFVANRGADEGGSFRIFRTRSLSSRISLLAVPGGRWHCGDRFAMI